MSKKDDKPGKDSGKIKNDKVNEKMENKTKNSKANEKAKSKAEDYAKNPDKLNELIDKASAKASSKQGPLAAVWTQLMACFRLLRAYANGTYREIPWQSLLMIIASVVYFDMPLDLIPDVLVGLGYIDDAALLGWTFKSVNSDIDAFTDWEMNSQNA